MELKNKLNFPLSNMTDKITNMFETPYNIDIPTLSSDYDKILDKMPSDEAKSLISIKLEDIENQYRCFGIKSEDKFQT